MLSKVFSLRFFSLILFGIFLFFLSCKEQNESVQNKNDKESSTKTNLPEYKIVNEDIYDAPVKTQIVRHIFVKEGITEENLRKLLDYQFKVLSRRKGFQYHDTPTNIYIYLYDSIEKAEAGQGLWIGMSELSYGDTKPSITIRTKQIELRNKQPEIKFGMSESIRKKVFKEIAWAEKRAMDEAVKRFPSDIKKQIAIENELVEKYKNELAKTYKITRKDLSAISVEGLTKQWPY